MKKITNTYSIQDFEILTDDGFVDLVALHETIPYGVFKISTQDFTLKCADTHILFDENFNEIYLKDLNINDVIQTKSGPQTIYNIVDLGYEEIMYDFELNHNSKRRYFTDGILSHNTELAKALAELIFDDENCIVRIDMSEYQEKHTVSRLIGAPPGYVGYDDGGEFDIIRRKPYSIVLLDEFEKAHPDVFNILLQVLDDGRLTDSKGRIINFKNTVIIMTSNLGSHLINDKLSKMTDETRETALKESKEEVLALLKKSIRPELLNRIDETIVFDPLTREEIKEIVKMNLKGLTKNLNIKFDDSVIDYVAVKGYAPEFGARPVKRVIQKDIVDELSKKLISGDISKEKEIVVSCTENTINIKNS